MNRPRLCKVRMSAGPENCEESVKEEVRDQKSEVGDLKRKLTSFPHSTPPRSSENQHAVTIAVETITGGDRVVVRRENILPPREGTHQRE